MLIPSSPSCTANRRHHVRELVCSFRPLRDDTGQLIHVPSLVLSDPRAVAHTVGVLIADQPVEVVGVACLSARHRLLAWYVASRGTRSAAPVSMPDVFLPACVTPGCVGVVVVHNHPSGQPTPSPEDISLTARLHAAAEILGIDLLDHLIVGDAGRYYSFREAGALDASPNRPSNGPSAVAAGDP